MPRVALVHDWLTGLRGGEKCLDRLCLLYPDSSISTLLYAPGCVGHPIEDRPIHGSWLQHLPGWRHYYRFLLPLFPTAAKWDLSKCDVVLSLSHCVAKAAAPPAGIPHICYCFTPMRYAWHLKAEYFGQRRTPMAWLRDRVLNRLRDWDRRVSDRVTHFIAISKTVQTRIRDCYDRDSTVIYPPVDTDFYRPAPRQREDFYLVVSALAPYKRIDHAVEACNRLRKRLIVIGAGQAKRRIRALAGPTVQLLGWQSDAVIRDHFRRCSALLFPGEEDFGIVPVEAQACGAPVIALNRGGATETVLDWRTAGAQGTGLLYDESSVDGLVGAIEQFDRVRSHFHAVQIHRWAQQFSAQRFDADIRQFVESVLHAAPSARRAA